MKLLQEKWINEQFQYLNDCIATNNTKIEYKFFIIFEAKKLETIILFFGVIISTQERYKNIFTNLFSLIEVLQR